MSKLQVEHVGKSYSTRTDPLEVLRDCSLEMENGDQVAIIGPSGSGKSTLLHIIGTLDTPTAGAVQLDGVDPFSLGDQPLAQFRNDNIGFVFQDHHLLPQLSVLENVLLPTVAHEKSSASWSERARELINGVGLGDRMHHRSGELSGGERQRAAVARALIRRPKLVLADEPTGSLDQANARHIGKLLVGLPTDEPTMLITVTHSMELAEMFSRRFRLHEGGLEVAP